MSGSSSSNHAPAQGEASSSRAQFLQPTVDDADDNEEDLLASDPLNGNLATGYAYFLLGKAVNSRTSSRLSFKRKTKSTTSAFQLPRFLSTPLSSSPSRPDSPSSRNPLSRTRASSRLNPAASSSTEAILPYLDTPGDTSAQLQDIKEATALDWYGEGPGRRVGYDDLTAIDWIFEYAKERQRQRVLYSSTSGLSGYVQQIADASQIWWVLIATGIAAGLVAAFIDVVSDWLGDLKGGVCRNIEQGGKFYLNKTFCCWGYNRKSLWSTVEAFTDKFRTFRLPRLAAMERCHGRFLQSWGMDHTVSRLYHIICTSFMMSSNDLFLLMLDRLFLLQSPAFWLRILQFTQSTAVYPKSRRFWEAS
jgi:chloride channel 3/4/5